MKRNKVHLLVLYLDCLQSAFSLKIRQVLISSSAIANHDVIITPSILAVRGFAARACLAFVSRNFAKKNKRLLAV